MQDKTFGLWHFNGGPLAVHSRGHCFLTCQGLTSHKNWNVLCCVIWHAGGGILGGDKKKKILASATPTTCNPKATAKTEI